MQVPLTKIIRPRNTLWVRYDVNATAPNGFSPGQYYGQRKKGAYTDICHTHTPGGKPKGYHFQDRSIL